MTVTASSTQSKGPPLELRREAPSATPRPVKRQPMTTEEAFVAAHQPNDSFLRYVASGRKGSVRLSQAVLDELDPTAAHYLYANNTDARIAFAAVAKRHIAKLVAGHNGTFFWVTFIPKQFVVPESEAAAFDPSRVQRWAYEALRGLSHLGMVEPAYYTNVQALSGGYQKAVSWHAHLILWGVDKDDVRKIMHNLNRRFEALLPSVIPAYAIPVSSEEVIEKLLYMLKAPQSNYRCYPLKVETKNKKTGRVEKVSTGFFRQKKAQLRPGEIARMCRVLSDKYLDRLAFAGGEGKTVLAAIRKEALLPLRREQLRSLRG